ncbi:MAG: hypothetical protein HUU54_08435 [Ignavibacteriaceae bacterium]|nr:hypothetical protein [Ignavibacteriaceae bacterium]
MTKLFTLSLIIFIFAANDIFSCTTFIISGKFTSDGKPILFKNRDTDEMQNSLVLFTDGNYRYIGLVNGDESWKEMVWGGYNETGFAIINSAAYNNNSGDTTKLADREGIIMKLALMHCRTLKDFENMLDTLPKPLGVDANFGVIDAYGGAAYYETGNFNYKRYDADDPSVCENGVLIRTNHSMRGKKEEGFGFCRFATATEGLMSASKQKKLTPQYLFSITSRNLKHSLTGTNLMDNLPKSKEKPEYRFFIDFIPRNSTASAVMIVGAKNAESARHTVMWTILGFPLTSVAVPAWITASNALPEAVKLGEGLKSPLCTAALKLKEECFPITYDRGWNYINLAAVVNKKNDGIMQLLKPVEDEIFKTAGKLITDLEKEKKSEKDIIDFYNWVDGHLNKSYNKLFRIKISG